MNNTSKIEDLDGGLTWQAEFDTSRNYVIKLLNNNLITIDNILINNTIISPINLSEGEKPGFFAKYGGADNPIFVHKDIYKIYLPNNANDVTGSARNRHRGFWRVLPLNLEDLIYNGFHDEISKIAKQVNSNHPALVDYIKMSWLQTEKPDIILYVKNRLVTVGKESDFLKKIILYRKFSDIYDPSFRLDWNRRDTSTLDQMVKWGYYEWLQFSKELTTLDKTMLYHDNKDDKTMLYHDNKDIRGLPQYNYWLVEQIRGFMYLDLIELNKDKPEFNNIDINKIFQHINMLDCSNFIDEVEENRAYVRLQLLFYTILLEEAKITDNDNFNRDDFIDNILMKYHSISLKTDDSTTFFKINEERLSDSISLRPWIHPPFFTKYPLGKRIVNTILNHRENLTPGIVGFTLTSKDYIPVLWGNSAKMEYVLKNKLS